jgi:hypothetical protein
MGLAGLFGAALVLEDQYQVAAGLNQQRVQRHGFADKRIGFAWVAPLGEPGAGVVQQGGNGLRPPAD